MRCDVTKERPILFSAPMVRAILEGRKTMTRRVIKDTGLYAIDERWHGIETATRERRNLATQCKHGQPGDHLWVKETSIIAPKHFATPDNYCIPDKEGDLRYIQYIASESDTEAAGWYKLKKSPSIFMPRWASRITLEITDVKVERLQDITENDALAEGIQEDAMAPMSHFICANGSSTREPVYAFETLWESINGPGTWDANPFVWAISFKRIKP
jgi:hypothetical protein